MSNLNNILLSKKSNEMFSLLRGSDLLDLLEVVENTDIEYRDRIYIPKDVTFGLEIEYESVNRKKVTDFIEKNVRDWNSGRDGSVYSGGEIRSPILTDERKTWEDLKKVCEYLKKENAVMSKKAGGHIHIGTPVLGDNVEGWRIFLKIVMLYENILYRFYYGDKLNGRPGIGEYALPISEELFENLYEINHSTTVREIRHYLPTDRYRSINFKNVKFYSPEEKANMNTIEIRCPNASKEQIIWQNNVNTTAKMFLSSGAHVIDEEYLDYRLKDFNPDVDNSFIYNEVFLKKVLELVDIIFSNNLDKVYFLRQYLKSFQSGFEAPIAVKAKRFIS